MSNLSRCLMRANPKAALAHKGAAPKSFRSGGLGLGGFSFMGLWVLSFTLSGFGVSGFECFGFNGFGDFTWALAPNQSSIEK